MDSNLGITYQLSRQEKTTIYNLIRNIFISSCEDIISCKNEPELSRVSILYNNNPKLRSLFRFLDKTLQEAFDQGKQLSETLKLKKALKEVDGK